MNTHTFVSVSAMCLIALVTGETDSETSALSITTYADQEKLSLMKEHSFDVTSRSSLTFKYKSCGDAYIRFLPEGMENGDVGFKFRLNKEDDDNNIVATGRLCSVKNNGNLDCEPKTSIEIESTCDDFKTFSVHFDEDDDRTVKFSQGCTIDEKEILSIKAASPFHWGDVTINSDAEASWVIGNICEVGELQTSEAPTSEAPTSEAPTSEPPTSEPPTSESTTSEAPTSEPPTSEPPTSEPTTSEAPTSETLTSEPPTSELSMPESTMPMQIEGGNNDGSNNNDDGSNNYNDGSNNNDDGSNTNNDGSNNNNDGSNNNNDGSNNNIESNGSDEDGGSDNSETGETTSSNDSPDSNGGSNNEEDSDENGGSDEGSDGIGTTEEDESGDWSSLLDGFLDNSSLSVGSSTLALLLTVTTSIFM